MLRFIIPNEKRASEYFELCKEYAAEKNSRYITTNSLGKAIERIKGDIDCENGIVQFDNEYTVTRWAENEKGKLVGTCRLRTRLQNLSVNVDGHIGYDVSPEYRKRGYGTEILRLALREIRKYNIDDLLITCSEDNIASCKIIEKNGGVFEKILFDEEDQKKVRRYWIKNR
jgi:predicted acetyltransferase